MRNLLLLATVGLALGCGSGKQAPPAPKEVSSPKTVRFDPAALSRLGVRVAPASAPNQRHKLRLPGTLEYNLERYAEVGSLVEGRVLSISARVGDQVKKGQRLGTVIVPSIAQAQAAYVSAVAAAHLAKANAERERALLEKQLTTAREAEVALAEKLKTEADVAAASARLQVLGSGIVADITSIQGPGTLTLVAPIAGVVVRRDAVLGRYLQPSETVFVIADPRVLWASVDVYEADLPYLAVNADTELTIDALPGRLVKGKVSLVEPQVGRETRVLRVRIVVPNDDGALRPGMFVRASLDIRGGQEDGKLLVPSGAVQPLGDGDVVFVEMEAGVYEVRSVRAGRRTSQVAEILEGLAATERIVVDGAFLLRGEVTKQ
ncbi:MAG: efflux RND transporter periplasmic adaptor subunit [Myxococcales bacterium]